MKHLGMNLGVIKEEQKENSETLLTIRKRCGTLIEGPNCPYTVYHDTAKTRDPYYNTKIREILE